MKPKILFFSTLAAAVLSVSCTGLDFEKELEHLTNRVMLLEAQVRQVNADVNLLAEVANGASVKKFEQVGTNVYKVTLGNGTEYTINTSGTGGAANLNVGVDAEGYWTLDGVRIKDASGKDVSAKGQDGTPGADGRTPVFGVDGEGYWTVKYSAEETAVRITDESGNPVKAQGSGSGEECGLIKEISSSSGVLTIVLHNGLVYEMPMVADFYCLIKDLPENIVYFLYEEEMTFDMDMKGVLDVDISVPSGWSAWLNDDNTVLTVKAPAAPVTKAAFADTRRDVTVRALGANNAFAMVKVKVEVSATRMSLFDVYSSGQDIVIAGKTYNKSVYGEPVIVTAESGEVDLQKYLSVSAGTNTVVFLESGAGSFVLTSESGNTNLSGNVLLLGKDDEQKAKVRIGAQLRVFKGSFTAHNIDFDVTESPYPVFVSKQNAEDMECLHFVDCDFRTVRKSFLGMDKTTTYAVRSIVFEGCLFEINATEGVNYRLLNFGANTVLDRFEEIKFTGNVFYNASTCLQIYLTFYESTKVTSVDGTNWENVRVTLENNTFYNVPCSRAYLNFYRMSNLSVRRNIFYTEPSSGWSTGCNIFQSFMTDHPQACPNVVVEDNIAYGLVETADYLVSHSSSTFVYPDNVMEKSATDPLAGKDLTNGVFTQAAGFEKYGAER